MMIDAVMYGMMPSAKTDICVNAPPEKRFSRPMKPESSAWSANVRMRWSRSTPGTGICRAESVDGEDEQGEQDLVAKIVDPEGVPKTAVSM